MKLNFVTVSGDLHQVRLEIETPSMMIYAQANVCGYEHLIDTTRHG